MIVAKSSFSTSNGVMVVVYGFVSSREARPLGGTLVATTTQPAPLLLLTPHSTPCCRRGVSRPTRLPHTWIRTRTRETAWIPCRASVAGSLCTRTSASRDCPSMTWIASSSNHLHSVSFYHNYIECGSLCTLQKKNKCPTQDKTVIFKQILLDVLATD